MSAIWGCVDFSGAVLPEGLGEAMRLPLDKYRIERFECVVRGNVVMGCGIQYITPEAEREPLPIFDEEAGLYFTSDCMIDNRRELITELCPGRGDIPDGELMYLAYRAWRGDAPRRVRGAFSFAAYDVRRNLLTLSADHASSRVLYYALRGSRVYFGTSIASILAALPSKPELNRRWLSDYLCMTNLRTVTEPFETLYDGVLRVGARRYILFGKDGQGEKIHWDPLSLPPLDGHDIPALRQEFLKIFRRAAGELAGRGVQAGIYLSSGMDSASVAAVYAEALAGEGRELRSYTSVPEPDYDARITRFVTENETEGVMALCAMHANIRPGFFPLEGVNALTNLKYISDRHELPLKTGVNMTWLYALGEKAREDGCRIMLSGQIGNSTISWGSAYDLATHLLYRGHPLRAFLAALRYGRSIGFGGKRYVWGWLEGNFPRLMGNRKPTEDELLEGSLVNRRFAREAGSARRIIDLGYHGAARAFFTKNKMNELHMSLDAMAVIGEYETKLGLSNGQIIRDITKDKLLWEFCLRAPTECFVEEGRGKEPPRDRLLVREGLRELLPAEISENRIRYGMQSADWVRRMMKNEGEAAGLFRERLLSPFALEFLDAAEVEKAVSAAVAGGREAENCLHTLLMSLSAMAIVSRHGEEPD